MRNQPTRRAGSLMRDRAGTLRRLAWLAALWLLTGLCDGAVRGQALPVTSGLYRHFKADAGVTTDASGNVSTWADQSPNAAGATQSGSGQRPALVATGLGGLPTLRFDGVDDVMPLTSSMDLSSGGLSVFLVARNAVRKNYNGLLRIAPALTGNASQLELYWQVGSSGSGNMLYIANRISSGSTYSNFLQTNNTGPTAPAPYIYSVSTAGTTTRGQALNGTPASSSTGSSSYLPASAGSAWIGVGFAGASNIYLQGDISEVIVYNREVTAAEQAQIEAYLANKYSIVLTTPTISSFSPASGTPGTSVTLTGTNLSSLTGVSFNGVAATTFSAGTGTSATATVPAGATTGFVTATSVQGTGSGSTSFTVLAGPTISSFSPATGAAGTTVTITGTNLDQVTGVQIGGSSATAVAVVAGSGNTQLTAVVGSGAQTGRVVLNYSGGTATSSTDFVVPLPTIARAEYFIDADPGLGTATAFTLPGAPAADQPSLSATVPLGALTPGFHALGVRSQDSNGAWSLTSRRTFYYEPAATAALANVNKVEYFIDTDPGFAAALDVPVTAGTDLSGVAFSVNISSLAAGFHQLGVRSRDANGQWSLTNRRAFYYEPAANAALANVTKVEYFVDTDPGFAAATDVPVTAAADLSGVAFNVNISSLPAGFHQLGVRSQDSNGKWSLTNRRAFYYEPSANTAIPNVTKVEYFVDAEPGIGNGTDVPVTAATDVSGVAFSVALGSIGTGFHSLSVRSRDANGKWSLTNVRSFYYEPAVAAAPNINKIEFYFDADPGFGSATDVPVPTPAPDLAGFGFTADGSALADGAHRVFFRSRDANGKWSLVSSKTFVKNGCASSANLSAGLASTSYNYGGSVGGSVEAAFNTDPATPTTSNSPYVYNGSLIQADLGSAQTISEVRVKFTNSATPTNFTLLIQTAPALAGPYTTVDTYTATFNANTAYPVVRTLAAPATNVRGLRLVFQSTGGNYVIVSGVGAYYFNCASPSITSFTPTGGAAGTVVTLTGTNLSGATAVTFNGVAASAATITNNTATGLTVTAPVGGTTGPICVTTPAGTACSSGSFAYPPTIATGTVSPTAFCSSTFIQVPFTTNVASYGVGNAFHFQLSDANGVFTAGSRLYGNIVSQNASGGILQDTVAFRTPAGPGYRVRVVASSPSITGTDNGTNLTIYPTPAATASGNSPVVFNGTIQLVAQPLGQSSYQWYAAYTSGGTSYVGAGQTLNLTNAQPTQSGKYFVFVSNSNGCQDSASVRIVVQPNAVPVLAMSQFSYSGCAGSTLNIGFSVTGNNFANGNTISAQLSNASGSFAAPTVIGSAAFTGQGSGAVSSTLPTSTPTGTGYRIRLVGSNPAVTSTTDNGSNLGITTQPTATPGSNSPVAYGGTIQLTAATVAGATYFWSGPSFSSTQQNPAIANAAAGNAGTYTLYVTLGSCTNQATTNVTVGAAPAVALATGPVSGSFCPGAVISVPYSVTSGSVNAGNTFTAQLSDASGSFGAPVSIGSLASTAASGTIAAQLPLSTPAGTGYRVRVVANNPSTIGSDNGTNLTVGAITYAWTGAVSTDWFNAANWSCGQVPGATSVVIIGSGAGFYPVITGSTAALALNLTVQSGASFTNNGIFNLYGSVTVNGTVAASLTSSWYFAGSGAQYIYGTNPLQVGNVYINSGSTLTMNNVLNVSANWTNNGGFVGGAGYSVYFNGAGGTQLIGGTSSSTFYSVYVNSGAVVNLGINAVFLNNFVVNGTFGAVGYGVVFGGSTGQTIGGSGTSTYYTVNITNTVGVTLVSNITVLGNWINDGQFFGSTYSVIFAGTAAQLIGGTQVTNFYNVNFQNPVSVTLTQNIYVLGGFVNSGIFYGYQTVGGVTTGCFVRFGGSTAQVINANATTYFYHFYVDNAAGVSLATNIYIAGNYYLYSGSFNPGTYTVYFNGFEGPGYVQTVGGYTALSFYGWNISSGAYVRLLQNVTWLGSFANAGTFYGYNLVGGVYTGYTGVFGGSAAQVVVGSGVYEFWHVTWSNLAGITLNQNIRVWGNWLNNGGYFANGYLVDFIGNVAQLIGGSVNTTFFHVTITNPVSVSLNQPIVVLGNWAGAGLFLGNGYLVYFNGAAAQTIFCGLNTRFFDLRFSNPTSVTLLSDLYLAGSWTHDGGFVANGFRVYFSGTGATQLIAGTVLTQFHHLTIVAGAQVQLGRVVTLLGDWTNNGSFLHGNYTVTFAGSTVQLIGGSTSTIFYGITFTNPVSVTLAQDIRVRGAWLNNGVFLPATYTVYFDGSLAQVISGSAVSTFFGLNILNTVGVSLSGPIFIRGNLVNDGLFTCAGYLVTFNGTALQNIGGLSTTVFGNLTCNNPVGVALGQNIRVRGDFRNLALFTAGGYTVYFDGSIAQGIYSTGTLTFHDVVFANSLGVTLQNNIFLTGNWTNNGGFLANGKLVTFSGSVLQLITGSVATVFHHFTIALGATVQQNLGITLLGDWTNNGTFLPNSLLVYFNGTALQTIGGSALSTFYDVTFNNAVNVSLGHDIDVLRNFVNQGGYCGCGFRTRFNGSVPQAITCTAGRTHFHDLTFDNAQGVTLLNGIYVSGNWVNNGGFLANNQLVTFDGTQLQTIGGAVLTAFYHWQNTNASAAGVTLLRDVSYAGNWTNNGQYCGCGFLSLFNGSTPQSLTCTTGHSNFHHLTLANTSAGGVTLTGNINVSGNWLASSFWNPQTYTVFFNGTGAQSIAVGGSITQALFYHLTISNASPAGVTLGCPLSLLGNWTNDGVFFAGLNTVYANGTTRQSFGGSAPTTFYNWVIANPAGASCTGTGGTATTPALGLQHVLTLATGGGNLACGGNLTLLSNATGTGMVVNQPGGGVCTGVATMQRFITGLSGPAGYRHYSSPMQLSAAGISTTVQEFADDLPVFELNPAYNTAGNTVTPFPTLFKYDETRLTAAKPGFDEGFMTPTATEDLVPLRGYTAQTLPTTTVDISGLLNTGNVSYPLGRGSLANSGWHLLGNPYPAPMDWDVVRTTTGMLTGVADALYVFQPSGQYTGTYKAYVNGLGTNGGSKDLAAMQGFFVRATAPTAAVSFTDAVRATAYVSPTFDRQSTGPGPVVRTTTGAARPVLRLEARNVATGTADETVIYFEPSAALGFSPQHDAYKVQLNGNGRPSLWSQAGPESFAINGLPDLATAPVIPLGVRVSQDGAHELALTGLLDAPTGTQVWLEDRVLNRRQNLAASPTYAFTMLASFAGPRFYLSFVAASPLAVTTGQLDARTALYPNPTTGRATLELAGLREQGPVTVDVVNVLGQPVQQLSPRPKQGFLTETLNLSGLPTGVYTVRIHAQEGTVVKRLVKE